MKRNINLIVILVIIPFLILQSFSAQAQNKIERLEPPFWWTGMKNPSLQLLVYGDSISHLTPFIDYEGIIVDQVVKVENLNYLFINLTLEQNVNPGKFDIQFKEDNTTQETYNYELLDRQEGSSARQGFTNSDVMYLITPDRFVNGNPDNDEIADLQEKPDRNHPGGRHGGDIKGITDRLDYIKDMGFSAIWVNPVLENDHPEYSYHGYSTTDYYKVDARFGTNEEYKKLGEIAQEKGIKLIMDMIANHCGSEHWWMDDLPSKNWINFNGSYVQTNHRRTTVQDPYASQSDFKHFQDGWFVRTMPDLNQNNPLMATYLIQNSIWWIEYAGLAGIRQDTYPYPDMYFMTDWTCRILEEYPNFNIVGEEWSPNPAIVSHWQRGKENPNGYTSCLPSVMDFPIQIAMSKALTEKEDWNAGFINLYEMLANDFLYADPDNMVIFPDNHDMDRFFTQVGEDYDLFKLGLTYVLTMRGIPQIYYGTEVLMANQESSDHGIIRSDFPGGWPGDEVNAFTGEGLKDTQKEAQSFLKKLLNWRKGASVIHKGKIMHYAPENGVYVYFRYDDSGKVMVALNKNEADQTLELARFYEMLQGVTTGRDVMGDKSYDMNEKLIVPARSPLVLELE